MTGDTGGAWSVVLGAAATLVIPVAIFATRYSDSYDLLHAGYAIPVAAALGIAALVVARRTRARDQVTLGRSGGAGSARVGRLLAIVGMCVAASATIALSVYGVLVAVG